MNNKTDSNRPDNNSYTNMANPGRSQQGVDKAPGEETPGDTENVVANTQKGKNKVDGDPSLESDQPVSNE